MKREPDAMTDALPDALPRRPEDLLTYRLNLVATLLGRDGARLAARHGLSLPEWRALWHVAAEGPCAPARLVARHALDKAQLSRALAALEARGLVTLRPDPGDRRRLLARVTAQGRRLHARMVPDAAARQARLAALLTPGELAGLQRALARLAPALLAAEAAAGGRRGAAQGAE